MAVSTTATTTGSYYLTQYYIKTFLEELVPVPKVARYAYRKPHAKNAGTVAYFPRMLAESTSVGDLAITEGTAVTPTVVSAGQVAVTLDQFGKADAISDLLEMTAIDTTSEQIVKNLAVQANNVLDKYALTAAYTSTSTAKLALYRDSNIGQAVSVGQSWGGFQMFFVDSSLLASNGQLSTYAAEIVTAMGSAGNTGNVMTATALRTNIARLKAKNAQPIPEAEGCFALLCHTNTAMKLLADSAIGDLYKYTDPENLKKGIVGRYAGCLIIEDNNILVTAAGSSSANLYFSVLLSKNALGVTDLDGHVNTYVYSEGNTSNPLNQYSTFGWKAQMGAGILNTAGGLIICSNDD